MRETFDRFARWALAAFRSVPTYQADFDDVAEMVVTARALRAHGFGARVSDTPLRLIVTVPRAEHRRFSIAGGVR